MAGWSDAEFDAFVGARMGSLVRFAYGLTGDVGHAELKKNGIFVLPGLVRMVVVKKPATKARKGINPFTGEPTVFKAKPARKVIKARPVKAAKDAIG